MRKVGTILRREVQSYVRSPIAYVLSAGFLVLSGYFFSVILFATQAADMTILLGELGVIFLFVAPLLTMRTLAEERRQGTDEFLLTSPLSLSEIVLGKFLGALAVYAGMLVVTGVYPIILSSWGDPDWGPILSGYLGLFLLGAAFVSVGVFASSLSENQVVAGMVGFGLLLLLWLVGWIAGATTGWVQSVVMALSLFDRFNDLRRGIIDTSHLLYYVSFIFTFLFLSVRTLEKRRWS